jgi:polysaccharide deacetylase family protein (PEP-CTERM system associated)
MNILSVDIEGWYEISCRDIAIFLLELFKKKNTRATFFVHGPVAQKYPDLIREINAQGHEIASHSWSPRSLTTITMEQFREEMKKSINLLTLIVGKPLLGFRAPFFSIEGKTFWVLDILAELGIKYDSSIFPIRGLRYGLPDFPRGAVRIQRGNNSIIEVPLSTVRIFDNKWPVSGGGYFRLLPCRLIFFAVKVINQDGLSSVVYCHSYELNNERLRYSNKILSLKWLKTRKKEKINMFRKTMRKKLSKLLDEYRFYSFRQVLPNL